MCKPETRTKSQQQQQKAQNVNDDYVRIIFIFFFLFPKFSTIIIYHVCENLKKKNVFRRCAQKHEAGVGNENMSQTPVPLPVLPMTCCVTQSTPLPLSGPPACQRGAWVILRGALPPPIFCNSVPTICQHHGEPKVAKKTDTYNAGEECGSGRRAFERTQGDLTLQEEQDQGRLPGGSGT